MDNQALSFFSVDPLPPKLKRLRKYGWIEERHYPLVDQLVAAMWDGTTRKQICQYVLNQSLWLYELDEGLMLLETVEHAKGRELFIFGMAGCGILCEEVVDDLKALAKHKGCSMIGGYGVPKGWQRAAPRLGFKPVSTHFVMEL